MFAASAYEEARKDMVMAEESVINGGRSGGSVGDEGMSNLEWDNETFTRCVCYITSVYPI
jgi:hypothetical protein